MEDSPALRKTNPKDGQIDFAAYSIEQLRDLEYTIDRVAFPENYRKLLAALKLREDLVIEPATPSSAVVGRFTSRAGLIGWLQAKFARSPVYGVGSLEIPGSEIVLNAWQRTWLGVAIEAQFTRDVGAVRNVVQDGAKVRFEIKGKFGTAARIAFRPDHPDRLNVLISKLPNATTSGFLERWSAIRNFNQRLQDLGGKPWVTSTIVAINIIIFAAMAVIAKRLGQFDIQELLNWGANFGPLTVNGQWWRLFTALFVHLSLSHVLINMWALWNIGRLSERLFGSGTLAFLYFSTGILASLASVAWDPTLSSVGASGAIFGIFGAFLAFVGRIRHQIPPVIARKYWISTSVFVLFNLMNGALQPGIDNAAHVGGLFSGCVLGYLLARPLDRVVRARVPLTEGLTALAFIGIVVFSAIWQVKGIGSELTIPEKYSRAHESFVNDEVKNLQLWSVLAQRASAGNISDAELGQRFEQEILPFWRAQKAQLGKENENLKGPGRAYALLVADFVNARYEWAKSVAALAQGNDPGRVAEGQKLMKENNLLQAKLDRIGIRARMDHRPRALAAAPLVTKIRQLLTGYHWNCVGASAPGDETDGPAMRQAVGCSAQEFFMAGDYERLDSLMNRSMGSLEDLPDGSSRYEGIVSGLRDLFSSGNLAPEVALGHTADWRRRVKSSVMADLAEAMYLSDWAWTARGSGFANSISPQNLAIYEYRTEMAAASLADVAERAANNPLWYTLSLNVGLDQTKDKQELRDIFDQGRAKAPNYRPLYRGMLRILMPRWGGSYEEVDKFINEIKEKSSKERGYERYAELYSMYAQLEGDELDLFADTPAFWSGMRQGYLGLVRRYRTSASVLNSFADFACRAGDKETYSRLRHDVGMRVVSAAWSAKYSIKSCDQNLRVSDDSPGSIMDEALPGQRILSLGGVRLGMTRKELLAAKGNPVVRAPMYWVYNSIDSKHDGVLTMVFSASEQDSGAVVRAIAYSGDELSAPKDLSYLNGSSSVEVIQQYGRQLKGNLTLQGEMTFMFRNGVYVNTHDEKVYRYGIFALPSTTEQGH
jgi:membrane associated rhomboid family serine protease